MIYLVAALVIVGVVAVLNLVLTYGVIRRLRSHTETLGTLSGGPSARFFEPGTAAPRLPDALGVPEKKVVAFFSTTCEPCREKLPLFRDHLLAIAADPAEVLVVVEGRADDAGEFREQLGALARMEIETEVGPLAKSFMVSGFPTFYAVEDGLVVAGSHDVADLPVPVAR